MEHLSDSRLEIDLHRAIGLDAGRLDTGTLAGYSGDLDFDAEDTDEPRTIVMRGFGPRWTTAPDLAGSEGDAPC